ncbi:hypothetical protein [Streptomyces anulatus]|uniref:Uncharacterized protein n=1 Tax=Streptomyces anulatus TaxID=1892 RepID=A0ABZ1ZLV1_STRAQ|nr:hypothetical protein [Streptomyces anulatus]
MAFLVGHSASFITEQSGHIDGCWLLAAGCWLLAAGCCTETANKQGDKPK